MLLCCVLGAGPPYALCWRTDRPCGGFSQVRSRKPIGLHRPLIPLTLLLATAAAHASTGVEPRPATEATRLTNQVVLEQIDFDNRQDFEGANLGFIARLDHTIVTEIGQAVQESKRLTRIHRASDMRPREGVVR